MTTSDETSIRVLHALVGVCDDSQRGYELAATDVNDPELARLLGELGAKRMKFGDELRARLRTLRAAPAKVVTLGGPLHRAWLDFKASASAGDPHAILVECERGEDEAVKAYAAALQEREVDEITHRLIQRHYEQVQAGHDRVRQLRDRGACAPR